MAQMETHPGPSAQPCPRWPRGTLCPSLQPRQHSPSWRHSDAGALCPESTWLACPQGPALPKRSGTRTRAPPPVGNVVASGLGVCVATSVTPCPGAEQGREAGLPLGAGPQRVPQGKLHPGPRSGSRAGPLWAPGKQAPFFSSRYKDCPCKAALARAQTGLVLCPCRCLLPSAHRARGGGIANDRRRPARVGAFVHSLDGGHFLGACCVPGPRGRPPRAGSLAPPSGRPGSAEHLPERHGGRKCRALREDSAAGRVG